MLTKLRNKKSLVFLDQVMVSGSNFILGILLARNLGIEGYGYYSLIWLVVLFFSSMQLASLISPMMSLGPKKNVIAQNNYYFTMIVIQFFYACLSMLLAFLFFRLIGVFKDEWAIGDLSYLVSIFIFVFLLQDFLRRYFFVKIKSFTVLIMDSFSYLGTIGVIAYYTVYDSLTLNIIFFIMISMYAVSALIGLTQIKYFYFNKRYTFYIFKKNMLFSRWLISSSLLQWGTGNFFILLAGSILGASAVGAIKAMQNLMGVFHVVFLALENILPMKFSQIYHTQGIESLSRYLRKNINFTWIIFLPFLLIVTLFSKDIVGLIYGSEYVNDAYLLIWFMVIYVFIYIGMLLRYVLRSVEDTKSIFTSYVVSLLFSMVTAYPLIELFGLDGVMIGMLGIQIITLYIIYKNVKRKGALV